jgi:hypothetical protein
MPRTGAIRRIPRWLNAFPACRGSSIFRGRKNAKFRADASPRQRIKRIPRQNPRSPRSVSRREPRVYLQSRKNRVYSKRECSSSSGRLGERLLTARSTPALYRPGRNFLESPKARTGGMFSPAVPSPLLPQTRQLFCQSPRGTVGGIMVSIS